jgi:hypothetical protein
LGAAVLCVQLVAEEIQLKDGSKITGKLTGVNGDAFQVKTAYGEIQVPRSEVVTINFPENLPAKTDAGNRSAPPEQVDEALVGSHYVNRTAGFRATVPEGWALAPELRKTQEIVTALKSPDESLFFLVTPEKFAGNLTTYRVFAETQYQAKFRDYEKVAESEVKLDGKTGIRLVWRGKGPDNGVPLEFLVYILPYEGRMIRLSFFTLEPLFNDAVPTFEKIGLSYRTLGPEQKASPH